MARLFNDNETYEIDEIATRLNVKRRWVMDNMISEGLKSRKVGDRRFSTGYNIRMWIEAENTRYDEDDEA